MLSFKQLMGIAELQPITLTTEPFLLLYSTYNMVPGMLFFQCFDAAGWATGRETGV